MPSVKRTFYAPELSFTEEQLIAIEAALANLRTRKELAEEIANLRASDWKWERLAITRLHAAIQGSLAEVAERRNERERQCANCPHVADGHCWISLVGGRVRGACYERGCSCERFAVAR